MCVFMGPKFEALNVHRTSKFLCSLEFQSLWNSSQMFNDMWCNDAWHGWHGMIMHGSQSGCRCWVIALSSKLMQTAPTNRPKKLELALGCIFARAKKGCQGPVGAVGSLDFEFFRSPGPLHIGLWCSGFRVVRSLHFCTTPTKRFTVLLLL